MQKESILSILSAYIIVNGKETFHTMTGKEYFFEKQAGRAAKEKRNQAGGVGRKSGGIQTDDWFFRKRKIQSIYFAGI